jgi:hypothetical protein
MLIDVVSLWCYSNDRLILITKQLKALKYKCQGKPGLIILPPLAYGEVLPPKGDKIRETTMLITISEEWIKRDLR